MSTTESMPHAAGNMPCPHCRVDLLMTERQGIEIDYCPKCRGVWLDRGELDKLIQRSEQQASAAMPQQPTMPAQPYAAPPPPGQSPWTAPAGAQPLPQQDWGRRHDDDDDDDRGYDRGQHRGRGRRQSWFGQLFDD